MGRLGELKAKLCPRVCALSLFDIASLGIKRKSRGDFNNIHELWGIDKISVHDRSSVWLRYVTYIVGKQNTEITWIKILANTLKQYQSMS